MTETRALREVIGTVEIYDAESVDSVFDTAGGRWVRVLAALTLWSAVPAGGRTRVATR
jgi:hypothetical protein